MSPASQNCPARDFEAFYCEHFGVLAGMAAKLISVEEAEQLAHDVLMSSLCPLTSLNDSRAWLVAAIKSALAQGGQP